MAEKSVDGWDIVQSLRRLVLTAAPKAKESSKWAPPVYEDNGPFAYIKAFRTTPAQRRSKPKLAARRPGLPASPHLFRWQDLCRLQLDGAGVLGRRFEIPLGLRKSATGSEGHSRYQCPGQALHA